MGASGFSEHTVDTVLSDSEVETAYNNQVPVSSQAEAEAGIESEVRRFSPELIKQAIDALASGGGLGLDADSGSVTVDLNGGDLVSGIVTLDNDGKTLFIVTGIADNGNNENVTIRLLRDTTPLKSISVITNPAHADYVGGRFTFYVLADNDGENFKVDGDTVSGSGTCSAEVYQIQQL